MKTETKTKIMCEVDALTIKEEWLVIWNKTVDERFVATTPNGMARAIEHYGDQFPEVLAEAINESFIEMAARIAELVSKDLEDIWQRMDREEEYNKGYKDLNTKAVLELLEAVEELRERESRGYGTGIGRITPTPVPGCTCKVCQEEKGSKRKFLRRLFRG